MAFEPVTLCGALWRPAGLNYVLLPEEWTKEAWLEKKKSASHFSAKTKAKDLEALRQEAEKRKMFARSAEREPEKMAVKTAPAFQKISWTPIPLAKWPQAWAKRFSEKRPQGKIAWTYWQLGSDLTPLDGESEDARERRKSHGNFIRSFFKDLDLPGGSHCLWPACLPDPLNENRLAADFDIYWSGIQSIGCKGVVIMGSQAAKTMLKIPELRPLKNYIFMGRQAWVLPDIDILMRDSGKYQSSLNFLRHALNNFLTMAG